MESWLFDRIRSTARRRVIVWCLALAALLALFALQPRYFKNFAFGPYDVSAETLNVIRDVDAFAQPFARIHGDEVIDTGLQEITIRKKRGVETGREVSANYYALAIGDRLLIVKSMTMLRDYEGELAPIPSDLQNQLFGDPDMAEYRQAFYPFYLKTEGYRVPGYMALGVLAVFLVFFLRAVVPGIRHMRDPSTSPVAARVQTWGNLTMVNGQIQREFETAQVKIGGWKFGQNFLVRSGWFKFDVFRYQDLLWAFKQVHKQSYFFIPISKSVAAVMHFNQGEARIQAREKKVDQAIETIVDRVPWAFFGHDDEMQKAFNKRRGEIVQGVALRKQQWEAQAAAAAG
ncbi:MAG: hypothetical protein KDJ14_01205 [Xanthomonadales bacterium]|nr:hypothetical protein [Xanthomonadales bacterium]